MAMKRAWRWVFLGAGVLLLLLAAVLGVASSASFQTAVARSFLRDVDPQAQLQEVSLGWSGGEIRGLALTTSGTAVKLDDAALKYSVGALLFGKVKVIDRVTLTGLVVNATMAGAGSREKAPTKPAGTVTAQASSAPTLVLIKQVDLSGTFFLPGQRTVTANFTGHDLGAGGAGQGQGEWVFTDESKNATVREIHIATQMSVPCDAQMMPQAGNLTVQLSAVLPGQAQAAQLALQVTAAAPKSGGARDFSVEVSQPGAGGNAAARLLALTGTCQGSGVMAGSFSVNCTSGQVAPFAFGAKLPEFAVQSGGDISLDGNGGGSVKAKAEANAGHWEIINPMLEQLGNMQLDAALDASWTNNTLKAQSANLTLAPAGGQPVVTLDLIKPLAVDFSGKTPQLTQGAGAQLVNLQLQVPVSWLALVEPAEWKIKGNTLTGQAVIGARDDGTITAETTQPLMMSGFGVTDNGTAALTNVSLMLNVAASYKDGAVEANLRQLILSSGTTPIAQLAANVSLGTSGNAAPLKAGGRLAVAVDQIALQPFAKSWAASLPPGAIKIDGTFDLTKTTDTLELDALEATVAQRTAPMFTVKLAQKVSLPLAEGAKMPALEGDLVTVEANGLPLELLTPLLPKGMVLTGDPLRGRVMIAGAGSGAAGLVLRTDQPLTLSRLNYSKGGKFMLSGVTVTLDPEGAWSADGKTMNGTARLQVTAPAGTLFDGTAQASLTDGKLAANMLATGGLNALAAQPLGSSWSQALPGAPQNYSLSANITKDSGNLTVQAAEARVAPPDNSGAAMAEVKLLQPVTMPETPANTTVDPKAPAFWPVLTGDLASVNFKGLPVGVIGLALPGYDIRGQTVTADLMVRGAGAGVYSIAADLPLTIERLSVLHNFDPLLDELTVRGRPMVKLNQGGLISLAVYDLQLASAGQNIGGGNIEYAYAQDGKTLAATKFNITANVAELLRQPLLHAYSNLNTGMGTLDGELLPDGSFKLNADFTQWKVRDPAREVKEMALVGATGKLGPTAGAVQLTAPLQGTGANGATNCTLNLTLTPTTVNGANGQTFSLNLAGGGLVPDDVMAIVNGFQAPNGGKPQRPPGMAVPENTAPDTEPLWGNMTGSAQVNLTRLGFDALDLDNVTGSAQMTPAQLTVGSLSAKLAGGAPLNFNGTLAFDPKQAALPYGLQANLSLKNFDTGAYFRARDPKAKVPLEGNFSISGTTSGRGANMDDMIGRVPFDFKLTSSGGTIYVLAMVDKGSGAALTGLSVVSGVTGILGGILGGKAPNVQQFSQTVSQLTTLFDKIQYSSMTFEATRGADRNINLTQLNVQSTDIVVNGSGRITYRKGTPIPEQPLSVNVQLGVKGNPAALLSTLRLTQSSAPDANGFILGPQFKVGGTIEKPDYGSFYLMLIQAPLKMLNL